MLLATWNVNSLRARLPRVLELLAKHSPDVVCLQETKTDDAAFPDAELADAGYSAVHHSAGRWNGVAILARQPLALSEPSSGLPGEPRGDQARWVEAKADGLRVASVYVPNGRAVGTEEFELKLAFLDAARERATQLAAAGPAVICGDMNVCRTDLDVYDPAAFVGSTHVTPDERERLEAIIGAGFADAFRELHPGRAGLHVVGLPRRPLPQAPGTADRLRAAERRAPVRAAQLRDRPRHAQGAEALGPRAAAHGVLGARFANSGYRGAMYLIIGVILLIIAIAGGVIIHPIIFALAIVALAMFFLGR